MSAHRNTGFTLIELLIVVSLTVILMLGATALFMTFLVSNSKGNSLQLVKNEGQYALGRMEFLVRNAITVLPNSGNQTCTSDMSEFVIKSLDGGTTTFSAEDDNGHTKIASNSGVYLTSDQVDLVSGPTFDCSPIVGSGQDYVTIHFTLRKGTPGVDQAKEIISQEFKTSVNVRSY